MAILNKEFLLGVVPGLESALQARTTFTAAFLLRRYVSSITHLAAPALLLDHEQHGTGDWVLNKLLAFEGGAWCGAVSDFFTDCLKAAGIGAVQYYYGWPDGLSHATTLFASVAPDGRTAQQFYYALDAYLGYYHADAMGKYMCFSTVLQNVITGDYHRIRTYHQDLPRHYLALPDTNIEDSAWLFPNRRIPRPAQKTSGLLAYPGAVMNWEKLFAPTSPSRHLADQRRGRTPLNDFLLDAMLVNPRLGGIEDEFKDSHRSFRLIQALMKEYGRKEGL